MRKFSYILGIVWIITFLSLVVDWYDIYNKCLGIEYCRHGLGISLIVSPIRDILSFFWWEQLFYVPQFKHLYNHIFLLFFQTLLMYLFIIFVVWWGKVSFQYFTKKK